MKINKALAPASKLTRTATLLVATLSMSASFADTASWIANCGQMQQAQDYVTAVTMGEVAQNNPYLLGMSQKDSAGPTPMQKALGQATGNFNCTGTVKGAFDSMLSNLGLGSVFGINMNTLVGGIVGAQAGHLCSDVSQAIGQTFGGLNLQCPHVNIPGFNNACGRHVNAGINGINVNTNGNLGGYSVGGNTSVNTGGNVTGSIYGNANNTINNTSTNSNANINGNINSGTATVNSGGNSSVIGNAAANVACWFTGRC